MAIVEKEIRGGVVQGYLVKSPATEELYCFWTKDGNLNVNWNFNGDFEKPTFRPSMKNVTTGEHFFVTDGKIQYLSDCRHEMAGKTVDMIDV